MEEEKYESTCMGVILLCLKQLENYLKISGMSIVISRQVAGSKDQCHRNAAALLEKIKGIREWNDLILEPLLR